MKLLENEAHYQLNLKSEPIWLLYTTTPNCSVCHADLPRVDEIANEANVPVFQLQSQQHPLLVGQLNLFSSPTVIIYVKGKEMHRQVRIIDFENLNYRLNQLLPAIEDRD